MKILTALLTTALTVPLLALLEAWGLMQMWHWYLTPQYGAGPNYAAWYGISSIASLIIHLATRYLKHDETGEIKTAGAAFWTVIEAAFAGAFGVLISVGVAGFVGLVTGWI